MRAFTAVFFLLLVPHGLASVGGVQAWIAEDCLAQLVDDSERDVVVLTMERDETGRTCGNARPDLYYWDMNALGSCERQTDEWLLHCVNYGLLPTDRFYEVRLGYDHGLEAYSSSIGFLRARMVPLG